jgi:hypothetical protein
VVIDVFNYLRPVNRPDVLDLLPTQLPYCHFKFSLDRVE